MRPLYVWDVNAGDGAVVGDVVARMGGAENARVFLNGRQAELDEIVEVGDRVELYPKREVPSEAVSVLAQRDGVVLAHKPAGLPTETTRLGEDSLVSALIGQLMGGKVHAATRLDTMVSGVCVCTLGRDAALRVQQWRAAGQLTRVYVAIAHGQLADREGSWSWPLARGRDRAGRHRALVGGQGGQPAETRYFVEQDAPGAAFLRLEPATGRMHQLRAHAARAGAPLYGDRLYGGPTQLVDARGKVTPIARVALHARTVETPTLRADAPPPEDLVELWRLISQG